MELTIAEAWPWIKVGAKVRTNANGSVKRNNFKGTVIWKHDDELMLENGAGTRIIWKDNNIQGTYIQIL